MQNPNSGRMQQMNAVTKDQKARAYEEVVDGVFREGETNNCQLSSSRKLQLSELIVYWSGDKGVSATSFVCSSVDELKGFESLWDVAVRILRL